MTSLAHIVNPFVAPEGSELSLAQPVTFESMRVARAMAQDRVEVRLFTTWFPADEQAAPSDFGSTEPLQRSIHDLGSFTDPRKLPLLCDVLERLCTASEGAEYLIYTNVDIALMPSFYLTVSRLIDEGIDAFVINRRRITDRYTAVADLPLMYAEVGEPHRGWDCFVFRREAFSNYRLGNVCLGVPWVGRVLMLNLIAFADRFEQFKDLHATFHLGYDLTQKEQRFTELAEFNAAEAAALLPWLESRLDSVNDRDMLARFLRQSGKWLGRHQGRGSDPKPLGS